jgi:hypothetical protein
MKVDTIRMRLILIGAFCQLFLESCQNDDAGKRKVDGRAKTATDERSEINKLISGVWVDELNTKYIFEKDFFTVKVGSRVEENISGRYEVKDKGHGYYLLLHPHEKVIVFEFENKQKTIMFLGIDDYGAVIVEKIEN